jgi:signal peptidase I
MTDDTQPIRVAAPRGSGAAHALWDVLQTIILSAILFMGINAVTARIRVDGYSMEPTLKDGEFVMVNKLAYWWRAPETGDVIVFRYPRSPDQEFIKRVIGLPGDRVQVVGGKVYVNEQLIEEGYIAAAPRYQIDLTVPPDALFVLGDNRNHSSDSHNWGPVPMEYVIGKAVFVYWPPQFWGVIDQITEGSS